MAPWSENSDNVKMAEIDVQTVQCQFLSVARSVPKFEFDFDLKNNIMV